MRLCRYVGIIVLILCFVTSSLPVLQLVDSNTLGENNLEDIIQKLQFAGQSDCNWGDNRLQQAIYFSFQAAAGLKAIVQVPDQSKSGNSVVCTKVPFIVSPNSPLSADTFILSMVSVPYLFNLKSVSLQLDTPPPNILG